MAISILSTCSFLLTAAGVLASRAPTPGTEESLRARIEALKPTHVAWRQIQWKTCLLEGLAESRKENKPVLLWVFIDRPADDERC